jgi:hypothetical protein
MMYCAIVTKVDAPIAIQDIIEIHPVIKLASISALLACTTATKLLQLTGRKRQPSANFAGCKESDPDVLPARAGHGRTHLGQSAGHETVDQEKENQSIHCSQRESNSANWACLCST